MKLPHPPKIVIIALCLIMGWVAGRLTTTGVGAPTAVDYPVPFESKPPLRRSGAELPSSISELRQDIRRAPSSSIPEFVPRVLAIDDPLLRRRLIDDLILRFDESNWKEAVLGCYQFTAETGIQRHDEWRFMKDMAAERIGGPVLDFYLGKGNFSELQNAALSWAYRDPSAAAAWIGEVASTHPEQSDQLTIQVLAGSARTDTEFALDLVRTLSPESRGRAIHPLLQNIRQSQGLNAMTEWGEKTLEGLADEPELKEAINAGLISKLAESANHIKTSRSAAEQLVRIVDRQDGPPIAKLRELSAARGWAALSAWSELFRRHAGDVELSTEILEAGPTMLQFSAKDVHAWIEHWPDDPFVPHLKALSETADGQIPSLIDQ